MADLSPARLDRHIPESCRRSRGKRCIRDYSESKNANDRLGSDDGFIACRFLLGAWLLWKHSFVTRRVEGTPRELTPEGNVDKWELLNAVDLRKECVSALKIEHKKSYDSLLATYPNEPVSQSMVADGEDHATLL